MGRVILKPKRKPRKLPDPTDSKAVEAWFQRIVQRDIMRLIHEDPRVLNVHVNVDVELKKQ